MESKSTPEIELVNLTRSKKNCKTPSKTQQTLTGNSFWSKSKRSGRASRKEIVSECMAYFHFSGIFTVKFFWNFMKNGSQLYLLTPNPFFWNKICLEIRLFMMTEHKFLINFIIILKFVNFYLFQRFWAFYRNENLSRIF